MKLSNDQIQDAIRVKKLVLAFFNSKITISEIPAKDLMKEFVKAGIFKEDRKNGLPIRHLLRELDKANMLNLIPQVRADRKALNTNWFFVNYKTDNVPKIALKEPSVKKELKSPSTKKDNDENYVLDLCDAILKLKSKRQHRFNFLLGDAGTKLPVDAYYESLSLVIEYRERQHTEVVKFFDRRQTVSGVGRGEQRKIYDQRRRDVLPKHNIKLIEISFSDFDYDSRKRIIRNGLKDKEVIKNIIL